MPSSLTPGAAIMQCSMGSTSCERWWRRPALPSASTAYWTRVRHGRDLAGRQLVALGRHDRAVPAGLLRGEAREPLELLGDDLALEAALGARLGVLPVAAAAAAGAGVRAGGLDPVLGRLEHLTASARRKRESLLAVRHPGDDPLAGQRVPYEEHLAVVRTGDAVAAVGDGADLDLVLLPDQRPPVCDFFGSACMAG